MNPRVITVADYIALPRPTVTWLIDRMLPFPGSVLLMGAPKAGKSFLALDLAIRVAKGETMFGYPSHSARVLYIQLDTGEAVWRQRLIDLAADGIDLSSPNLTVVHPDDAQIPLDVMRPDGFEWLRAVVGSSDAALVVIDTLREAHSADENDSTGMKMAFDRLTAALYNRSVVYVHHTKKIPDDQARVNLTDMSRGSTYVTGKVDALWLLHQSRFYVLPRFDEPFDTRVVQKGSGFWDFPELEPTPALLAAVRALVQSNPGASDALLARLAEGHQIRRPSFYRALWRVRP